MKKRRFDNQENFLKLRQEKYVYVAIGVAAAAIVLTSAVQYNTIFDLVTRGGWVDHSARVIGEIAATEGAAKAAESAARGFVLTGDAAFLKTMTQSVTSANQHEQSIRHLTVDNPRQQERLGRFEPLLASRFQKLNELVEKRRRLPAAEATSPFAEDGAEAALVVAVDSLTGDLENEEYALLDARSSSLESGTDRALIFCACASAISLLLLGVSGWMIRFGLRKRTMLEIELRHEKDLFATLMDTVPDYVYFKDVESRFLRINAALARHLGLSDVNKALGKSDADFYDPEHAEAARTDEEEICRTGRPMIDKEELETVRAGREVWVMSSKLPMVDGQGTITGTFGISRDITMSKQKTAELDRANRELSKANEDLKDSTLRLERSNRELQDFASVASHDLQEPLRKVQAFGDRLKSACGAAIDEPGRDYLDRMLSATKRMQSLIQDLLRFARIAKDDQPFQTVDLAQVTRDVLVDLEVQIAETGALVEVHDLPTIDADAIQMRQLLQNLIGNALKFRKKEMPPNIRIHLRSASFQSAVGSMCRLTVEDNGIGFDEKYLDRIFTVFQRLHGRSEYEGTGVGLAICRKIVHRHGGDITAKSALGEGTSFVVTLPSRRANGNAGHANNEGGTSSSIYNHSVVS